MRATYQNMTRKLDRNDSEDLTSRTDDYHAAAQGSVILLGSEEYASTGSTARNEDKPWPSSDREGRSRTRTKAGFASRLGQITSNCRRAGGYHFVVCAFPHRNHARRGVDVGVRALDLNDEVVRLTRVSDDRGILGGHRRNNAGCVRDTVLALGQGADNARFGECKRKTRIRENFDPPRFAETDDRVRICTCRDRTARNYRRVRDGLLTVDRNLAGYSDLTSGIAGYRKSDH